MNLIGEHKNTTKLQRVANTLYDTDGKGRAMNFKSEKQYRENGNNPGTKKRKNHIRKRWKEERQK
jgi:hypothetical protein